MSDPEIARRCLSCGASVRHSAAFCPQCGEALEKRSTDIDVVTDVLPPDHPMKIDEDQGDKELHSESAPTVWAPAMPEPANVHRESETVEPAAPNIGETRPILRDEAQRVLETQPLITNTAISNQTLADIPSPVVRRPGQAPPPLTERPLRDRVDKIRKVSSVMIDQAAYDPSMRFLLVAAVLFIIFLVLMLLSKVVG
jgi:hypothetical protein